MAIQFQNRRGTVSENNSFTGAAGEVVVDTTNNRLRVHDGATVGGTAVGDYINVKDFGAVGDGVTDDTLAIQAALDFISSYIHYDSNRSDLYFPDGEFLCTYLKIEDTQHLTVRGTGNTKLRTSTVINSTSDDAPFTFNNCDYLEIKDIVLSGATGTSDVLGSHETLLRIFNTDYIKVNNVTFLTYGGYTFVPQLCNYLTVSDCFFNQGTIWSGGVSYAKYTNNTFLNTKYDSLKISAYIPDINNPAVAYSDFVIISNNIFEGSSQDAIDTYTRGQELVITDNILRNTSVTGIQIKTIIRDPADYGDGGSSDIHGYNRKVIVSNNQLYNCGYFGIIVKLDDEQAVPTDLTSDMAEFISITNNMINGSARGIYIRDTWKILISGNTILGCDYGIYGSNFLENISILNNFIDATSKDAGIYLASYPNSFIAVNDNTVIGGTYGIIARINAGNINNNIVHDSTKNGIYILYGNSSTITGNLVKNVTDGASGGIGIVCTYFLRCVVADNISINNDNGFKFTATSDSNSTDGRVLGNISKLNTVSDVIDNVTTTNFVQANNTFTI